MTAVNVILGTASVGNSAVTKLAKFDTPDQVNSLLDAFYERGYHHIDTARGYAYGAPETSEPRLGAVDAGKRFTIDTKARYTGEHPHTKDKIIENVDISLKELKVPHINVYYLHVPDRTTPLEDAAAGMNEACKAGKIKQFGISNHSPDEVEEIVKICKEKGYLKPTVYQGQYNAITPGGEVYSKLYNKPELEDVFQRVSVAGHKHGISGHAAALRWTSFHSILDQKLGDAIILGASTVDQLKQNLDILEEGPLPQEVADSIEGVYSYVGDAEIKPWF
ncbi:hypothetical protein diail_6607 [Diaporthe ilicicola]|nr:hypothetical protein diail_6607 [Diaporthe ilicicola]